jgi:pilus assembly protein Flp/PilA
MSYLLSLYARLTAEDRGATAVEYGIMVALIAIVIILAVTAIGGNLQQTFNDVANAIQGV